MRICIICAEYPPSPHGGIGTATQSLAREFVRTGHRVQIVGLQDPSDHALQREVDQGVEVTRIPISTGRRVGWLRSRYRLYKVVAAAVRRGEIDLVEAPDFEGWTAGWKRLDVPVVIRLHGSASYFASETGRPINRLIYEIERMALNGASFHCATSKYAADATRRLFGLTRFEPEILYNPVAIPVVANEWNPLGADVVFTGTLTLKKGVIHLSHAWPEIAREFPKARLHLYGRDGRSPDGGSMREFLIAQLPHAVRQSVVFHGGVTHDEVILALRSAHLAVFPSLSEAFGLAPMESMAQGCPTIYSSLSCGTELITNEQDGLLVDPRNIAQLAGAMRRLLGDSDLASRLGSAGRKRADDFSIDKIARRNLCFYEKCIDN